MLLDGGGVCGLLHVGTVQRIKEPHSRSPAIQLPSPSIIFKKNGPHVNSYIHG